MKEKDLSKKAYEKYMIVVNNNIIETERRLEILNKCKKVSKLSYEEWKNFMNGNLSII